MSEKINGITYYKKISNYEGDITKKCGLTGAEIDSNFYFLRGNDIKEGVWDSETNMLVLIRENGDKIYIDGINLGTFLDMSDSTYDAENGVLNLDINGYKYQINGFSTCDCDKLKYDINTLTDTVENLICRVETAEGNVDSIRLTFNEINQKINDNTDSIAEIEKENNKIKGYINGVQLSLLQLQEALGEYSGNTIEITNRIQELIENIYTELFDKVNTEKNSREEAISTLTSSLTELNQWIEALKEEHRTDVGELTNQLSSITINDDIKQYEYNLYVNGEVRGTIQMPPPEVIKDAYFSGTTLILVFQTADGTIKQEEIDIKDHINIEHVKDVKLNGITVVDEEGVANIEIEDSKDYLTSSITIDSQVGGFNIGDTIESGTTIEEVLKQLFSKREEYPTYEEPSITINNPNTNRVMAVGSTFEKQEITYTLNDGEYISTWEQPSPNVVFSGTTVNEDDLTEIQYGKNTLSYKVKTNYSAPTNDAVTNLGKSYKIGNAGETNASATTVITGVYPVYKCFYNEDEDIWSGIEEKIVTGNTYVFDYETEDNTKRKAFLFKKDYKNLIKVEAYNDVMQKWDNQPFSIINGPSEDMGAYVRNGEDYEGPIKYRFTLEDK